MHVIDRRNRKKPAEAAAAVTENINEDPTILTVDDVPGDDSGWLSVRKGNRINRLIASPGEDIFKDVWMKRVFAQ
jgi:hypothetical protein